MQKVSHVTWILQELSENMGLIKLNQRLQDPELAPWFANIFPRDNPKNMRFSINFFTSIGLGGLTDALREHLAALPKILAEQRAALAAAQQGKSSLLFPSFEYFYSNPKNMPFFHQLLPSRVHPYTTSVNGCCAPATSRACNSWWLW